MFVGLDVHKRETQVYLLPVDEKVGTESRVRTTSGALRRVLADVSGPVVLEAVGFYRPVVRWLVKDGHEVHVANPRLLEKPKVKTDKIDAQHLARLLKADLLAESWVPSEEVHLLRDLVRHRRFLGEQTGRLKSKVKHELLKHGHFFEDNPADSQKGRARLRKLNILEISSILNLIESMEDETKVADEKIKEEAEKRPNVQLLTTIPGVGAYTALGIFAEVGDFSRFPDPEKLASYAGLAIGEHQSGDHDRRGHITKEGNKLLLTLLVEAAQNHVRHCPDSHVARKFQRKKERSGHKSALVAAARSLTHAMYAMIRDQTPFQVNRNNSNESPAA